jgi:hypothetical protein
MAAAVIAAICLLDIAREPRNWRRYLPTLLVCAGLTLAGLLLKGRASNNDVFIAQSLRAFVLSLGKNLAWPLTFLPWFALLNLLSLALLGWTYFRSPARPMQAERMTLAVGLWSVLHATAAAYARGGDVGTSPAWRYMDTESLIMVADCLSIVLLVRHHRPELKWKPLCYAGLALWAVICISGLWLLTKRAEKWALPGTTAHQGNQLASARAFMARDDPDVFITKDRENLPYPDVPKLVSMLRNQEIRRMLPACVREPLAVARRGDGDGAFVTNGYSLRTNDPPTERSWGSFSGAGASAQGEFESLPIAASTLPYLEIPVAGDLGEPGLTLELVELGTEKVTRVNPFTTPGKRWANAYVKAPAGEFKIVARDQSETKWFAFKAPRETGRLSCWTQRLVHTWKYCLLVGLIFLLASLVEFARLKKQGLMPPDKIS